MLLSFLCCGFACLGEARMLEIDLLLKYLCMIARCHRWGNIGNWEWEILLDQHFFFIFLKLKISSRVIVCNCGFPLF